MAADRHLCRNSSGSESPEEVTRMEIERIDVAADGEQNQMKETSNLRRSNSAPMFNGPNMSDESPVFQPIHHDRPRVRRFSTHITGSPKPQTNSKGTSSRVIQIKHEESMDIVSRETEGEREVQSAFQMSQSWDDLHLDASIKTLRSSQSKSRFSDPLSIMPPSFPLSSSPSPTRTAGKQCFSPSTQTFRNNSMSPSPIPSPTRGTVTRRSMSPVLRPSNLGIGVKRKAGDSDMDTTPSKRIFLSSPSHPSSTASISSISSDESSPLQRVTTENNIVNNSMLSSPSSHFQFSNSSSNSV
ncbi:hypothetical protein HOLleu_26391 [Holothuria leucospilota]|uniref:Protein FAM122A n=1 Tax=Holothuria leucospilota TaxID=206669 RepID=A0A9Q1H1X9_HOLLE|nr:hypothetical protein HOLleu_26391 [Holothuria leucospilota]